MITVPKHGGNLVWAADLADCTPADILDFSASINPLGPPASAVAAIQAHLPALPNYPDPEYGALRQALSQVHHLPIEWILPGNGAAELLTWAGRELADLAATCIVTPAFGDYFRALQTFSGAVVSWPIDLAALGTSQTRLPLTVCPVAGSNQGLILSNPHNPIGQLLTRQDLLPYLETFALVVIDEAFMDFLPPDQQESLIDQVLDYPNLVILRSLTKFYSLPGLRLGYAIAHPDRLRRWQTWRDPWPVNSLAAAAAIAILQDTAFQQLTWSWLLRERAHLFQAMTAIPGLEPYPSAANFLLVRFQGSVAQLQECLLKQHRILIRDCQSFDALGDRYFRVAVKSPEANQRLIQALTEISHHA
ncbi:threonine-phosphate decarboxylase [Leptolyngbya sp. 'hensonii']|uniref:threonine-phosphate decarboxylase CobD n=1 Tax=Leptolyngbya sp. 'hensonii' TaxID=1922337 RepID=UPI00094F660C|nr:threonine-phosphate decarboxylase CobD [Leptolyngbya sp. 'hensonii']OLP17653.1 threonine-phosphate decarboxylase [Leptolyngbya sp. 'hensonii']